MTHVIVNHWLAENAAFWGLDVIYETADYTPSSPNFTCRNAALDVEVIS